MSRIIYWSIMGGAALMAGTLLALPLWDYYHYRQPTSGGLPTSPTTLAVMTGAPVPPSFYPAAELAARSRPPGETDPAPRPVTRPGSADRHSARRVHSRRLRITTVPDRTMNPHHPGVKRLCRSPRTLHPCA